MPEALQLYCQWSTSLDALYLFFVYLKTTAGLLNKVKSSGNP